MKRGLVLGKFAPLHRGHQHLIETALAAVDELVVLVYDCPDVIDVPLPRRAGWIRTLYPEATVLEAPDGPRESGRDPRVMRAQERYVLRRVPGPITHFFSGEWYGEHMSRALHAEDVRVDPDRARFPVSGTLVRADPWAQRAHVHPVVYRDLVGKVVLLGAESTGKSTLAERLAREHRTQWMPEYGREYWLSHQVNGTLTPEQLVELAAGHVEREDRLVLESDRWLFVDTNVWTTAIYARWYHRSVPARLEALALEAETRYAHVFVCGDDVPYVDDGTRAGPKRRKEAQREVVEDLARRGVAYQVLTGDLDARVAQVKRALAAPPRR